MELLNGFDWEMLLAQGAFIALFIAFPYLYRTYLKPWFLAFYRDRMQPQNLCAIIGFVIGYPILFYKLWTGIDLGASSTAAIGLIFVPFAAAFGSLWVGAIGYSIGSVIRAWRTRERRHVLIAVIVAVLSVISVVYLVMDAEREQRLAEAVTAIAKMDDVELSTFLDSHEYRTNRYALGAVAMNPLASDATLARIAALDDPKLHERYGGSRELMSGNRKGLAVMRLVARHANVEPATLEVLSTSRDPYVLGDVAGNKATPRTEIERLYRQLDSTPDAYLVEWGLAYNVATPAEIMRQLAKQTRNQYTLRKLANNAGAPEDVRNLAAQRVRNGDYKPY